ncbi:TetR family transcriptional regulator C-terminal domain-containing protein [Streptomyces canarius]
MLDRKRAATCSHLSQLKGERPPPAPLSYPRPRRLSHPRHRDHTRLRLPCDGPPTARRTCSPPRPSVEALLRVTHARRTSPRARSTDAATAEIDALIPERREEGTPTAHLARFLARTTGEAYDAVSRLWINARHLSRYREVLREQVARQERVWRTRLEGLIREGVEAGEFRTDDTLVTTLQILIVLDGLGADANIGNEDLPEAVVRMAFTIAERELGLEAGALSRLADTPAAGGSG